MVAEQLDPVGFVPSLGVDETEKDGAFLTGPAARELTVYGCLRTFVGEVSAPAFDLGGAGRADGGGFGHGILLLRGPKIPGNLETSAIVNMWPKVSLARLCGWAAGS
ncbi:MAG: hypothetical protein ABWY12_04800 [Burkholderiales bacterium]